MQLFASNNSQAADHGDLTIYNNGNNNVVKESKNTFYDKYQAAKTALSGFQPHALKKTDTTNKVNLLALGKISHRNPTVSDVLFKHPVYGKKCWKIIHAQSNQGKPFNHIQAGTQIYIDPKSNEISWDADPKPDQTIKRKQFSSSLDNIGAHLKVKNGHPSKMQFLGRISDENPTVSSLLVKHSDYDKKCWRIIHSPENKGKPFEKMKPGTDVFINPENFKISWTTKGNHDNRVSFSKSLPYAPPIKSITSQNPSLSNQLESSVRSYMGRPYSDLNCYELVIRGLRHVGIRYSGKDGLKEKLVQMAVNKGLPTNSYLTGEGIIKTTGNEVFTKSFQRITNPKADARRLVKEMAPFLDNGLILSFSTPTRGHMGIVSNNKELWTFINSGTLDNQFAERKVTKGVGEEDLGSEIYNWLRLAAKRNEPLQITLGKVSGERLAAQNLTFSEKFG